MSPSLQKQEACPRFRYGNTEVTAAAFVSHFLDHRLLNCALKSTLISILLSFSYLGHFLKIRFVGWNCSVLGNVQSGGFWISKYKSLIRAFC